MEWLEIIELRSIVLDNSALKNQLTDILKKINGGPKQCRIKLFSNHLIYTDFCIFIKHSSGSKITKSKLGRHIDMALKNFGLTNHKIWVNL